MHGTCHVYGGFPPMGDFPNGWFVMDNPIKIDGFWVPTMTQETSICAIMCKSSALSSGTFPSFSSRRLRRFPRSVTSITSVKRPTKNVADHGCSGWWLQHIPSTLNKLVNWGSSFHLLGAKTTVWTCLKAPISINQLCTQPPTGK